MFNNTSPPTVSIVNRRPFFFFCTHTKIQTESQLPVKMHLLVEANLPDQGAPVHPTQGMQRLGESHQRAGERPSDRRESCETTVVSMPEQRNGTERVERHGPSLRPNLPRTGGLPRLHLPPASRATTTKRHPSSVVVASG